MLDNLPTEVVCIVASYCTIQSVSSLTRVSRYLHAICNPVLYRKDFACGCFSAYHAITYSSCESVAVKTLQAAAKSAKQANADLLLCRNHGGDFQQSFDKIMVFSSIHLAAARGLDKIVDMLIECGIPVNGPEGLNRTPLFEAIRNQRESTAILLLRHGASHDLGWPKLDVIHGAIIEGLESVITFLVQKRRVDLHAPTSSGCSPMMLAIFLRKPSMMFHLIRLGASLDRALTAICDGCNFSLVRWAIGVLLHEGYQPLEQHELARLALLVCEKEVPTSVLIQRQQAALITDLVFLMRCSAAV